MPRTGRCPRRLLASSSSLAVAASGLALAAAPADADPAGTGLVISEVYGGGGNSGAAYTHDFVELFNPTNKALPLDGLTVQYRSAAGNAPSGVLPLALSGELPAGRHHLVRMSSNAAVGEALPTPDTTGSYAMSGSSGQVLLVRGSTPFTAQGDLAGHTGLVDMVAYGTSNSAYEKATAGTGLTSTTSAQRDAAGSDTDDNSADLAVGVPTPTSSASDPARPAPEPPPEPAKISRIQGKGFTSPLEGELVRTTGVVTAAPRFLYGFYLQSPSAGSADPKRSDGIFVYYPNGAGSVTVRPGDHVEVTGEVAEHAGQTQVVSSAAGTRVLDEPAAVTPYTGSWPATDAEKEALEGMLFDAGAHEFTVTNTYSTHQYGEVGLALGDQPLVQPTEVVDAQDVEGVAAVVADNAARAITLDDGASTNYTASGSRHLTPPYVSNSAPVRVGAEATFTRPVILTEGGSPAAPTYRFQPLVSVTGPDYLRSSPAVFEDTRTAAPDEARLNRRGVADLKISSFNVLNYFTTLGDADDDDAGDGGCTSYDDRTGDGNNVRGGCDQRGAWDPQDLQRQQSKIVAAINALDADVVGLMEIENSLALGEEPDEALRALVDALNADAGAGTWAANPSSAELPPAAEMDVISNAIIYKPAAVHRTGEARALGALSGRGEAFDNAREPIAQAFTPRGGGEPFLFVVNHLKSKGSGADDGTGQGNANPDRVAQAAALADWVTTVQRGSGIEATYLVGDFNAYTMEDPMQVLHGAGYTDVEALDGHDEYSYSFSGLAGSLDHVLANEAALAGVTGADIWDINSGESLAMEYSRYNSHGTDFHAPTPYRSSDHDPVVVGIDSSR